MIIDFRVENFLSIKEEQILSFEATSIKDYDEYHCVEISPKLKLLKIAAIYGPNASGKTNILKALDFMRDFVLYSSKEKLLHEKIEFTPFKFSEETIHKPGKFELNFINEGIRYTYGFKLNSAIVEEEWLYCYPKTQRRLLFSRRYDERTKFFKYLWGNYLKGEKKRLELLTKDNSLFISTAAQFKQTQLEKVYNWFKFFANPIILPDTRLFSYTETGCMNDCEKKEILALMDNADLNVSDLIIEEFELDDELIRKIPKEIKEEVNRNKSDETQAKFRTLHFEHLFSEGNNVIKTIFSPDEESDGTIRFFELTGPLNELIQDGGILVIDELESSLHPNLVEHILTLFLEKTDYSQLIFSTHNVHLLESDLIRRDEIWFTERKKDHSTELYCLSDFMPRKDKSIKNGYMSGAYGALPILKDI